MRQRTMFVYVTSGAWYWGFRCRECRSSIAIEEAVGERLKCNPKMAVALTCENGHLGTWAGKDVLRFQAQAEDQTQNQIGGDAVAFGHAKRRR